MLLPVRNGAPTLRVALESLQAQIFRDFRVVVVDDGSTDATPRILSEAMSYGSGEGVGTAGPVRAPIALTVIRLNPGVGIAGALAAAALAAGDAEFLARQDADDRSLPERFARQVAFLDAHPEIGLVATGVKTVPGRLGAVTDGGRAGLRPGAATDDGGAGLWAAVASDTGGAGLGAAVASDIGSAEIGTRAARPTDGWRRYERWLAGCVTPEEIKRGLWIESPLPHPTVMMRRAAYELAGGYREVPWAEDYDLWLRMLRAGIVMAKIPETLYEWGDHPGRATRTLAAYTPEAFHACRAHHLVRYLDGRSVIVWGAGRDGRRASRALLREGADIRAFLDIDPRKIGRTAYGRPIVAAEDWLAEQEGAPGSSAESRRGAREGFAVPVVDERTVARDGVPALAARPIVLAAVGTDGARELIRARLVSAGLREGADFLCIA